MTAAAAGYLGPQWDWGDRLRKIRRTVAGNISQEDMAKIAGVKASTYSAWEGGRNQPTLRVATVVATRIEERFRGQVSAAWVLGAIQLEAADQPEVDLLPRMDSNHQPCGYRSDYRSHPSRIPASTSRETFGLLPKRFQSQLVAIPARSL